MKTLSGIKDPQTTDQSQTSDSSQLCYIGLSGIRKHTSIRCDAEIWKAFKQLCSANGLSTCDLLEKTLIGLCVGLHTHVAQSTTINVVVDAPRVIRRVRRRQLVFEDEVEVAKGESCHYCLKDRRRKAAVGRFRYRPDGRTFPLCNFHAEEYLATRSWEVVK